MIKKQLLAAQIEISTVQKRLRGNAGTRKQSDKCEILALKESQFSSACMAYCYMKPNSQKNDVRCHYTHGAPEHLLLQIHIDIQPN